MCLHLMYRETSSVLFMTYFNSFITLFQYDILQPILANTSAVFTSNSVATTLEHIHCAFSNKTKVRNL